MSNHTPEPWKYEKELSAGCDEWLISMDAGDRGRGICIAETRPGSVAGGKENARRIVTCVNACAGMADPAAEIAELKRQRDELLGLIKCVTYHSIPVTVSGVRCAAFPWSEYEEIVNKAKGGAA